SWAAGTARQHAGQDEVHQALRPGEHAERAMRQRRRRRLREDLRALRPPLGQAEIAKIFPQEGAAALSHPTLGVLAGKKRLVNLFMSCVLRLVDGAPVQERERYELPWNRWTEPEDGNPGYLHSHPLTGMPRTVLGMVATNAPWRTVPQLSTAMAAAAAAGAFGIFYNSIWQMSAALPTP